VSEAVQTYAIPDGKGHWDEDDDYSLEDWMYTILNDETRLGYWEWVAIQREQDECDGEETA
jgi:hypothetical protein